MDTSRSSGIIRIGRAEASCRWRGGRQGDDATVGVRHVVDTHERRCGRCCPNKPTATHQAVGHTRERRGEGAQRSDERRTTHGSLTKTTRKHTHRQHTHTYTHVDTQRHTAHPPLRPHQWRLRLDDVAPASARWPVAPRVPCVCACDPPMQSHRREAPRWTRPPGAQRREGGGRRERHNRLGCLRSTHLSHMSMPTPIHTGELVEPFAGRRDAAKPGRPLAHCTTDPPAPRITHSHTARTCVRACPSSSLVRSPVRTRVRAGVQRSAAQARSQRRPANSHAVSDDPTRTTTTDEATPHMHRIDTTSSMISM